MVHLLTQPLVLLVLVVLLGISAQWLAWKTRQPAILYLLLIGLLVGPIGGVLQPDALFGDLLFPFISLSVAVILFEGSLTLRFSELGEVGRVVRNLVTVGALVNFAVTACAVHWFVGLDWPVAMLFGAIMIVTGPTVIMPMLRTVRPRSAIARTLRWEGIVIDPLGAIFALLVFEWILAQQSGAAAGHVAFVFFKSVAVGFGLGAAAGQLFGLVLRHQWLPEYLHNFAAVAAVAVTFALSDVVAHESGLLAVTVMGVWLANMRDVHIQPILEFKESLTVIFVSTLFIVLAARLDLATLKQLGWGAVAVLLTMQFVSRPLKVLVSTWGSALQPRERMLLAWIGPRGIVAAAVSAVFAIHLERVGLAGAEQLVPLAFAVIIGTVVIQSATARPLARALKVTNPDVEGCLIIGANPVARAVGEALRHAGVDVVLCDTYRDNIRAAGELELPTYYGNALSEHARLHIDMSTLGSMLGLSHHDERNLSAALRYRDEFGYEALYILAPRDERRNKDSHRVSRFYGGRALFGDEVTYSKLASMISRGAAVRKTRLTEAFGYEHWREHYGEHETVALFATDPAGHVHWYTSDKQPSPGPDWTIYALSTADAGRT